MTLTTALALLGGAVLLALLVQGIVATRRAAARRAVLDAPASTAPDSLHAGAPASRLDERIEPSLDTIPGGFGPDPALVRPVLPHVARLDPLIDAIVPLMLERPIGGAAVLAHLPPTRRAGSKPFLVEGLDADSGQWQPIVAGGRYSELQGGVQLANRGGPLNEIEYSEFVHKMEALAEAIDARAEPPDMLEVAARARELDQLTAPLDAVLTVTLRSNSVAWSVAYVQQVAGRLGFVAGAVAGRQVLPAAEEGAPPLLALSVDAQAALASLDEAPQASAVRECTLALDVPQTPESAEAYPLFHRMATKLADDLDATPVDDQGQPLTLHAFASIGKELDALYRGLEQLDLAAGSPAARRLFT